MCINNMNIQFYKNAMYMYIHTCIHTNICIYIYIYMHINLYINLYIYIYNTPTWLSFDRDMSSINEYVKLSFTSSDAFSSSGKLSIIFLISSRMASFNDSLDVSYRSAILKRSLTLVIELQYGSCSNSKEACLVLMRKKKKEKIFTIK